MGKYFGTDGFRGEAGITLTADHAYPNEEKFLSCTKKYIENLFGSVCQDANTVMVDQIVPPTNLKRYQRTICIRSDL